MTPTVTPAYLRAIYQARRRKYQGQHYYSVAKSQYKFFEKAAAIIQQVGAAPDEYIEAQFMLSETGKFPWPSQLASPAAISYWYSWRAHIDVDWLTLFIVQLRMLKVLIDIYPERSVLDIVRDPAAAFHASFRVLLLRDSAADFLHDAQQEVLNSTQLRQFLERTGVDVKHVFGIR